MKVVILYTRGKEWQEGKPHWEQKLVPHRKYLVHTLKDKLVTGERLMDDTGGIGIVKAEGVHEEIENS